MIKKVINLNDVRNFLDRVVEDNAYPLEDRLGLYRLLDKLSDSEEFEIRVNREFSAYKLRNKKDDIVRRINAREEIVLPCNFVLHPYKTTNWQLYWNEEIFLDSLDPKIAKRIALDINVAFSIKVAQMNKYN